MKLRILLTCIMLILIATGCGTTPNGGAVFAETHWVAEFVTNREGHLLYVGPDLVHQHQESIDLELTLKADGRVMIENLTSHETWTGQWQTVIGAQDSVLLHFQFDDDIVHEAVIGQRNEERRTSVRSLTLSTSDHILSFLERS